MKPLTAVRHRFLIVLTLSVAAVAACVQARAETRSDQIQLRFDYAGARKLFTALNQRELSSQDIAELYKVQGLAGMVDNVTRFIPEVTRREFEQHLLKFIETGKEPGHNGYTVWDFKRVLATRGEVEGLIGKLEADESRIIARTLRELEPFRPDTGPLTITVYFVAGGVSDGFVPERSREPSLYVNLTRARGDLEGVESNLTHEIYHVMQQSASRRAGLGSIVDEPEKLELAQRLLATTLWEGSANYAADPRHLQGSGPYLEMWRDRFAQNTTPQKLAEHFALFETVLNDLQARRMSWDDAYARGFAGPQSPFYFVGHEMTRVIDQRCGRQCVQQLFNQPPAAFFERYIEIYKRDASIRNRFSSGTEASIAEGPKPAGVP
ncbi:MAG TPA: DUF5700 domain-containing putative Zn-dependent protease [Steroidobacteraceae bacterium]|jgi:putative zinc-dependent peptidase DUF5700|nr:DUF5700 domain-containing putative Zn-dependent protease [Steroidobacteraceae bacterium]